MIGYLVNDWKTTIPGTKTLWDNLLDWLPGLMWAGNVDYPQLAHVVEHRYEHAIRKPAYIIRNASYFRKLNLPVPTISLLQDIFPEDSRLEQVEVCRASSVTVANSAYTVAAYPELSSTNVRILPLPVDFDLFHPMPPSGLQKKWGIKPGSVCWVGAASEVKGWDLLLQVIQMSKRDFVLIRKDADGGYMNHPRVTQFFRMPHHDLVQIYNACDIGLCTSRHETQHLAGLEMGACGLPLVTTNVGAYYNRQADLWGMSMLDVGGPEMMASALEMDWGDSDEVRTYWALEGFEYEDVRSKWVRLVEDVVGVHA